MLTEHPEIHQWKEKNFSKMHWQGPTYLGMVALWNTIIVSIFDWTIVVYLKNSDYQIFWFLAYAKGHDRERFSPITGNKYPQGKNHNSANLEVESEENTSYLRVPGVERDTSFRYNNNRRNEKGKFLKRSQSPYARENKGKDKAPHNSAYKGKNFDENFQATKTKDPVQSTSKDKVWAYDI